jgi:4-amino-4-deoxy-L-arabinose transferase-like glycosyltransferase
MSRSRKWLIAAALALPVIVAYSFDLGRAPIYLHHDEVFVSLNAQSIASTGRDPSGERMPLYFHIAGDVWQTPISIYFTALFLKWLTVSEALVRVPALLVGLVSIVLIYLVAKRLFHSERLALVAAALLSLTPAHFIHSRLAFDHLYPLVFVLGWLLCLLMALESYEWRRIFAGTLLLGIGVYSYLASLVLMPVYLVLTCLALFDSGKRAAQPYVAAAVGFALPLTLLVPWLLRHPAQYSQHVRMYKLYDANLNPLQGARDLLSHTSITERVSVWYTYFNPSFLFFGGDASLVHSTREVGVFLLPLAVFLPLGIFHLAVSRKTPIQRTLLWGFFTAPMAGAIVAEYYRISRALVMLPFAILIATYGVDYLLTRPRRLARLAAVGLLALAPIQFGYFWRDYFTGYRVRSAGWFEGNIAGALEEVIERQPARSASPVYLSAAIPWIDAYWHFYTLKHHRDDLLKNAVVFDPKTFDVQAVPKGGIVVSPFVAGQPDAMPAATRHLISEPNKTVSFAIEER